MVMTIDLAVVATVGIAVLGVAASYGAMSWRVRDSEKAIRAVGKALETLEKQWTEFHGTATSTSRYIPRAACDATHRELGEAMRSMARDVRGLDNFARWAMTKQGLSVAEINTILEDGR
jgi:hypothetical protein